MTHALQSATYGSATKMITRFNVLFLVCYVLNEMPIELRYEQMGAATPNTLLAQKMWELLRPFCFKLCATTRDDTQQHETGCVNGRNMHF